MKQRQFYWHSGNKSLHEYINEIIKDGYTITQTVPIHYNKGGSDISLTTMLIIATKNEAKIN
jgi:hypothetical protein